MKQARWVFLLPMLGLVQTARAQEPVDYEMVAKIRSEAFGRSDVMKSLLYLTEVSGPRLVGSPNYNAAAEWARGKLGEWGLSNARLEDWGAKTRGWTLEGLTLEMTEPYFAPLIGFPKAFTVSTQGVITGTPIVLDGLTPADLEKYKGKLKEAIVLLEPARDLTTDFDPDATRFDDERLTTMQDATNMARPITRAARGRRGRGPAAPRPRSRERNRRYYTGIDPELERFLRDEQIGVLLSPSRGSDGTLFVSAGGSHLMGGEPGLPAIVMIGEHYNQIARLVEEGIDVQMRILADTRFHDDVTGYNVLAEIPGTDPQLKDEVVMLGGHLDSWHSGTGATDNAAGCAVAMEVVRILKALDIKPRRTVRIALWASEERGHSGSIGYVTRHFGDAETMELKPDYDKLAGYFNLDNGTGRIRGVYLQQNQAVRPIFEAWLKPFHDLGAKTLTISNTGGTDHESFDAIGLPGFQFIQDPVAYNTRTHHTNMDTYDHIIPEDLMQASAIIASFVYHTAMRDEKLPGKPRPTPRGR